MTGRSYVLLVEDDEALREITAECLRDHSIDVVEAADGAQALAHLECGCHPTAIVCDVMLPGVLGKSVAEYVDTTADLRDVPIVFVTGTPDRAPRGYRVMVKPISIDELLEFLAAAGVDVADHARH